MLHMVVHIPVYEPENGIEIYRSRIKPVIRDVFGEPRVLGIAEENQVHPCAIECRQTNEHQWQNATEVEGAQSGGQEDRKLNAGFKEDLPLLTFNHEILFGRRHRSNDMTQHPAKLAKARAEIKQVQYRAGEIRGALDGDLGVTTDDNGIRVMSGVTPPPECSISKYQERGNVIDGGIHP